MGVVVRLALAGIGHESNSFAPTLTGRDAFEDAGVLRGTDIVAAHAGAASSVTGFLDLAGDDVEIVPLLYTFPWPSGPLSSSAYEAVVAELLASLRTHGPWDGVLLAQHGAAVAEHVGDADGDIVGRVRALVGPAVPIGLALDMHANLTPAMVAGATATVLYRTNPHVDPRDRARECGRIVIDTVRGKVTPVQALLQLPLAVEVVRMATDHEPLRSVTAHLTRLEQRRGVLSVSVSTAHPYADVAEMGASTLVVTDGDPALAAATARELAAALWAVRDQLVDASPPSPIEALLDAATGPPPVGVLDIGDNIGGGSPGDSTILLQAALGLGLDGVVAMINDPDAVRTCVTAGVGHVVTVAVGGRSGAAPGAPLVVTGKVRSITDGRSEADGPSHAGFRHFNSGTTATLDLARGSTLIITSRVTPPFATAPYDAAGGDLRDKKIIILKGVISPQAAFAGIVSRFAFAATDGSTAAGITRLPYTHRRRPLYPFEPDTEFDPFTSDDLLVAP